MLLLNSVQTMSTRFHLGDQTTLALHEGEGIGHCTGDVIWEASYVTARFVADASLFPRALLVGDGAHAARSRAREEHGAIARSKDESIKVIPGESVLSRFEKKSPHLEG